MCQRPEFDRPKPASSRPVLGATVCAALLALGLPTCVALGVLPDPAVGWAAKPSTASVATAAIVLFGALCIVERGARLILDYFLSTHELLGNPEYRRVLARHAMDTTALVYISYLGLSMCSELDWTKLPATPHARIYLYMPRFAWACVAMLAFQVCNSRSLPQPTPPAPSAPCHPHAIAATTHIEAATPLAHSVAEQESARYDHVSRRARVYRTPCRLHSRRARIA